MAHYGTNNLDNNESKAITDAIIKIGNVFLEKSIANIILTGLYLPRLKKSKQRNKTLKVNNYLKKFCRDETNKYYLEQDRNCAHKHQSLNTSLCYKDYLHLIESGNDKC